MNLTQIDSLTSFQSNPLINDPRYNQKNVFLLYGNDKKDTSIVRKIKTLLKYHNYNYKSKRNLTIRQINNSALFRKRNDYNANPEVLIFPSIYGSEESATAELVSHIVCKKAKAYLGVIPIVYDNQLFCTHNELNLYKPLNLSCDFNSWWDSLKPILGRPTGRVHCIVTEDITDAVAEELESLVNNLRSHLSSSENDSRISKMGFLRDLDLSGMMESNSSSHHPKILKRHPSTPAINQPPEGYSFTAETQLPSSRRSLKLHSTSVFTETAMEKRRGSNFLPLDKETHVYIVHNADKRESEAMEGNDRVLSKVKQMKCLLTIHGYRCMTMDDIPPGENIIKMAVQSHEKSYATVVIDFSLLDPMPSNFAEHAYLQYLEKGIKFIPVSLNHEYTSCWKYRCTETMNTLDITGHHSKWFPKLENVLKFQRFSSADNPRLAKEQEKERNMMAKIKMLPPLHQRIVLSRILTDQPLTKFIAQSTDLPKRSHSDSTIEKSKRILEMEQNYSDTSSSQSSIGTLDSNISNHGSKNINIHPRLPGHGLCHLCDSLDDTVTDVKGGEDFEDFVAQQREIIPNIKINKNRYGSSANSSGYFTGSATSYEISDFGGHVEEKILTKIEENVRPDDAVIEVEDDEETIPFLSEDSDAQQQETISNKNNSNCRHRSSANSSVYFTGSGTSIEMSAFGNHVEEYSPSAFQESTFINDRTNNSEISFLNESINMTQVHGLQRPRNREQCLIDVSSCNDDSGNSENQSDRENLLTTNSDTCIDKYQYRIRPLKFIERTVFVLALIYLYGLMFNFLVVCLQHLDIKLYSSVYCNNSGISRIQMGSNNVYTTNATCGYLLGLGYNYDRILSFLIGTCTTIVFGNTAFSMSVGTALISSGAFRSSSYLYPAGAYIGGSVWNALQFGLSVKRENRTNWKQFFAAIALPDRINVVTSILSCGLQWFVPLTYLMHKGLQNVTLDNGFLYAPFKPVMELIIQNSCSNNNNYFNESASMSISSPISKTWCDNIAVNIFLTGASCLVLRGILFIFTSLSGSMDTFRRRKFNSWYSALCYGLTFTTLTQSPAFVNWEAAQRFIKEQTEFHSLKFVCVGTNTASFTITLFSFLITRINAGYILQMAIINLIHNIFVLTIVFSFNKFWTDYYFEKIVLRKWFVFAYIVVFTVPFLLTMLVIYKFGVATYLIICIFILLFAWVFYQIVKLCHLKKLKKYIIRCYDFTTKKNNVNNI